MSKRAEQRALEAVPPRYRKSRDGKSQIDSAKPVRKLYIDGYEQAEKDLGWISVKDRVPDTPEYVFTCIDYCGKPQCVGFHYYKDEKWWEGYEEDAVGAVEYWMPIPKLP